MINAVTLFPLIFTVYLFGRSRQDADGLEVFLILVSISAVLTTITTYGIAGYIFHSEKIQLFKFYFDVFDALVPDAIPEFFTMLFVASYFSYFVWIGLSTVCFVASMMVVYVFSVTSWMMNIRRLW